MLKQKTLLASCAFCLVSLITLSANPVLAVQIHEKEVAQGDGDPMEISPEEQLLAAQQLADEEKKATAEEDVATITAEGDFVLPTYLLPVTENSVQNDTALNPDEMDEELASATQTEANKSNQVKTQTTTTTKTTRELPIVMIKQTELIPVSEQMEVERQLTGSTAQTRRIYEEAIARQKQAAAARTQNNIMGQPAAFKNTAPITLNKRGKSVTPDLEIEDILADTEMDNSEENTSKKPLLLPLKPQQRITVVESSEPTAKPLLKTFPSAFADKVLSAAQADKKLPLIMPQDLKVSFYPNAADFSGQTIKWIKAFSWRAMQDPRYIIEIRLSNQNPTLQQKRLYVIQRILTSTGLSQHQILVDYVDRPVDSLILRTVKKPEDVITIAPTKGRSKGKMTINW